MASPSGFAALLQRCTNVVATCRQITHSSTVSGASFETLREGLAALCDSMRIAISGTHMTAKQITKLCRTDVLAELLRAMEFMYRLRILPITHGATVFGWSTIASMFQLAYALDQQGLDKWSAYMLQPSVVSVLDAACAALCAEAAHQALQLNTTQIAAHVSKLLDVIRASLEAEELRTRASRGPCRMRDAMQQCQLVSTVSAATVKRLSACSDEYSALLAVDYVIAVLAIAATTTSRQQLGILDNAAVGDAVAAATHALRDGWPGNNPQGKYHFRVRLLGPVYVLLLHYCPAAGARLLQPDLLLQLAISTQALCAKPWTDSVRSAVDGAVNIALAVISCAPATASNIEGAALIAAAVARRVLRPPGPGDRRSHDGSSIGAGASGSGGDRVDPFGPDMVWGGGEMLLKGLILLRIFCADESAEDLLHSAGLALSFSAEAGADLYCLVNKKAGARLETLCQAAEGDIIEHNTPAAPDAERAAACVPWLLRCSQATVSKVRKALMSMARAECIEDYGKIHVIAIDTLATLHRYDGHLRPAELAALSKRLEAMSVHVDYEHAQQVLCAVMELLAKMLAEARGLLLPDEVPLMAVCSYHLLRAACNTFARAPSPAALPREFGWNLAAVVLKCCAMGLLHSVAHSGALNLLASLELRTDGAPPECMQEALLTAWADIAARMLCGVLLAAAASDGVAIAPSGADDNAGDEVTQLLVELLNPDVHPLYTERCIGAVAFKLRHVTNQQGTPVFSCAAVQRAICSTPVLRKLLDGPSNDQIMELVDCMLRIVYEGPAVVGNTRRNSGKRCADDYGWYEVEMMQLGLRFGCSNPLCLAGTRDIKYQMCGRCKSAWYCSRACQTASWGRHRKLCKAAADHQGQ